MIKVNPLLTRLATRYGLVTALFTIIAFLVFYYMGQQPWRNLISFMLDILIIGVFIFLSLKEFRSNVNQGELRFYHGMSIGFIVYLFTAVGFSLFYFAFINWIEPGFLEQYIKLAQEDLILRKDMIITALSEESYNEQYLMIDQTTSGVLILDAFIKRLFIGLIITPIFSVVLRTHQR